MEDVMIWKIIGKISVTLATIIKVSLWPLIGLVYLTDGMVRQEERPSQQGLVFTGWMFIAAIAVSYWVLRSADFVAMSFALYYPFGVSTVYEWSTRPILIKQQWRVQ